MFDFNDDVEVVSIEETNPKLAELMAEAESTGTPLPDCMETWFYNPKAAKGRVINISTCRCGGGKTENMLDEITDKYVSGEYSGLTIIATITNKQGFQSFEGAYNRLAAGGYLLDEKKGFNGTVRCELVSAHEASDYKGVVVATMSEILSDIRDGMEEGKDPSEVYNGIMVTSHKSFTDLPAKLTGYARVFVDEIPNQFFEFMDVNSSPEMMHRIFAGRAQKVFNESTGELVMEDVGAWCVFENQDARNMTYEDLKEVGVGKVKVGEKEVEDGTMRPVYEYHKLDGANPDDVVLDEDGNVVQDATTKIVKLKDKYREEALGFVIGSNRAQYLDASDKAVGVVEALLYNFDNIYMKTTVEERRHAAVTHNYHGHQAFKAYKFVRYAGADIGVSPTLLGASIEDSVAGFIMKNVFEVELKDVTPHLPKKHTNPVTMIPYLKAGNFTDGLKYRTVGNAIEGMEGETPVIKDVFDFVNNKFGGDNYLLFANSKQRYGQDNKHIKNPNYKATDLTVIDESNRKRKGKVNIQELTTAIHGMNNLTDYTQAAFIAALNPTPDEEHSLRRYALARNIDPVALRKHVRMERFQEAAYQCVLRTAIRAPFDYETGKVANPDADKCIFIVPDMECAAYIANRFEDGLVTYDTSDSRIRNNIKQEQKDDAEKRELCIKYHTMLKEHKATPKAQRQYASTDEIAIAAGFKAPTYAGRRTELNRTMLGDHHFGRQMIEELIQMNLLDENSVLVRNRRNGRAGE